MSTKTQRKNHLVSEAKALQDVIDADLQMMSVLMQLEKNAKRLDKSDMFIAEVVERRRDIELRREEMIETLVDVERQLKDFGVTTW